MYRNHWWWRAREKIIIDYLRSRFPGNQRRIIDIGCGEGLMFEPLSALGAIEGLEPTPAMLQTGAASHGKIHHESIEAFRPGAPFDLALMLDVIEHLDDRAVALHKVLGMIKPGGSLLITVPAHQCLWTKHDDLNDHKIRFDKRTLAGEITAAGFQLIDLRYIFNLLFFPKFLLHFAERWLPDRSISHQVPPKFINTFVTQLCVLEGTISSRVNIPFFGSSLLALCRRPG